MSKRKLGRGTGSSAENISKSARKFIIPALLKTEQIEVDVKPEITTPCLTDSKSSVSSNSILYTCSGCGKSGYELLPLGYRLVKTTVLAEVGTQTGDESSVSVEFSGSNVQSWDRYAMEKNGQNTPVPVPAARASVVATSAASPIIVSSGNGKQFHIPFIFISPLFILSFLFHIFLTLVPHIMHLCF